MTMNRVRWSTDNGEPTASFRPQGGILHYRAPATFNFINFITL